MRWLSSSRRSDERGAVVIIVAFAMVALLGFAAIAIDTGALYVERAQLQNGADAAALAVAQECARDKNCTDPSAKLPTAESLANANANDSAARVSSVSFPTASSVRVDVATKDGKSGAGTLALTFAPILGIDDPSVGAYAKAAWGIPVSGPSVLPLAFSPCVFTPGAGIRIIRAQTSGAPGCPGGIPGGFGWLASEPAGSCSANVDISLSETGGDTGNDLPNNCTPVLQAIKDKVVLLPVYTSVVGTGSGAVYDIDLWAAFRVLGWKFPSGTAYRNLNYYPGIECKGDCNGLIGEFINYVSLDDRFKTGTTTDHGVAVVSMIP